MLPRLASTEQLAISIFAGQLAAAAARAAPDWIKATPRGPVQTRDGHSYAFNPETLDARFRADAIDIPLDLNHALDHRATTRKCGPCYTLAGSAAGSPRADRGNDIGYGPLRQRN